MEMENEHGGPGDHDMVAKQDLVTGAGVPSSTR